MISEDDAERAVDWLRDHAAQIGKARAERLYMEQWIKTVKATLQAEQGDTSVAAAEVAALSSPKYLSALQAYREAIQADETFRFLATAAEAKVEFWRSSEASRRAGLK